MYSLDNPIPQIPTPIPDSTILGTITVRRSMRIANKKRINYDGMILVGEKKKSSKETVRDILKMEISPIRQIKNLTIEARHTLSLQESKKKRLQFEKSLFLPNNKKRKDVLNTLNRKSLILKKTKVDPNTCFLNTNELNKRSASPKPNTSDLDFSSESSHKSDRTFQMKSNLFVSKKKCNEDSVATEEGEATSSKETTDTTENMSFPSYVAYRTKGNKIKLVQTKVGQTFAAPTTVKERLEHRGLLKSATFEQENKDKELEEPESTTKSNENENPSVSNYNSAVFSPDTIIDLTQKSQSIERPKESTHSVRSQSEVILGDSLQFNKLLPQPESMSAINFSSCLTSNSSNSMEFVMQSPASNDSTAYSSDCLETSNTKPPNIINHSFERREYTPSRISGSLKTEQKPTEAQTTYLIQATSPKPLGVIVSDEMQFLPISSQLIQDAEVQSSSTSRILQSKNETILTRTQDEATVSTSITEDIQPLEAMPNFEYCMQRKRKHVSRNQKEVSNEQASINQPSRKMQPNFQRHFEAVSKQRKIVEDENTASTSLGAAQQSKPRVQVEKQATQNNMHGKKYPKGQRAQLENPKIQSIPNIEFNPQHCSSRSSTNNNGNAPTQQVETQSRHNNEILNPLTKMQTMPNCSRYFTPFYLERPVVHGAETTPSTVTLGKQSAEQQQLMQVANNERHLREPPNPSSSKQETTDINAHFYPTRTAMEDHGQNLQYSYSQSSNSAIGASQQISSQYLEHASEHNNQKQQSSKPYTRTSQLPPKDIPRPETIFGHPTAPAYNNHPYYSPCYHPSVSSISTNQNRLPPFPAIQQQNMHSHNVPNTSNFNNSPPPNANPNIYGYPPRNDPSICPGNPHQPFINQPYFPGLQNLQQSSANQKRVQTEYNQVSYDSRNIQPPNIVNNEILRYHSNHQNPFWGQHKPAAAAAAAELPNHHQPILQQRTIEPNKWLNERFEHIMRPHDPKNDKSNWLARPQEPIAPISTGPVDMNAWMRARTQQVTKPPELTTEQRISQLEEVVNSFNKFVHNFQGFNSSLVGTAAAVSSPAPSASVAMQTPPPWQTMRTNSPILGNIATQPEPDARIAWAEYNNLMSATQMNGNIGYQRSNLASENSMRMDGNPVNQYPVPQIISHQINAADSTTGRNSNSCLDLRSFRPTQHYNQLHPHNTSGYYKNQYNFFKTH